MCGDTFTATTRTRRAARSSASPTTTRRSNIDRCTFDGNSVDATTGNAGGLYLEYATITMTATTISNNSAHYGGGLLDRPQRHRQADRTSPSPTTRANMGGGVWFAGGVTGTFLNCTVAGNGRRDVRRRHRRHAAEHDHRRQHAGHARRATNCSYDHGDGGHDSSGRAARPSCAASVPSPIRCSARWPTTAARFRR